MTEQTASTSRSDRTLNRLYRISMVVLTAFVVLGIVIFVGRAAVYKIHAYERGLHLRGGRFVRVENPGWHIQIPLVDTVLIVEVSERLGYVEQIEAMTSAMPLVLTTSRNLPCTNSKTMRSGSLTWRAR